MHIITGLAVAALLNNWKRNSALEGLPRFKTGPIRVAHALPGRIRFIIPDLRDKNADRMPWIKEMNSLESIRSVTVNPISGSVLVEFDKNAVDPPLVFGTLARFLGLEEELEKTPVPLVLREIREIGKSLNHTVYDQSGGVVDLWTLAAIALIVLGTQKTLQAGWASLPAGFTLLWWALNSLARKGDTAT